MNIAGLAGLHTFSLLLESRSISNPDILSCTMFTPVDLHWSCGVISALTQHGL